MPKPAKAKQAVKEPKQPGRPSDYTEAQADSICEHIAGGKSLVSWCNEDGRPSYTSVMRWLQANEPFRDKYTRAREAQADFLAEEIVSIADTPVRGIKTVSKLTGIETTEGDMIEHRRLQVDARKWYASKLAPKKYGDKTETTHKGSVGVILNASQSDEAL